MKEEIIKIELDGKAVKIELFLLAIDKVKKAIEEKTGLIYGHGDMYAQTIGQLEAWKCRHSPEDPETFDVILSATFVIAHSLAEMTGGNLAVTKDAEERLLVFVPNEKQPFVIMIDAMMDSILKGNYDYSEYIKRIKLSSKKETPTALRIQLREAIEAEDYELCAKIRDKIAKQESKIFSTKDQFGKKTK